MSPTVETGTTSRRSLLAGAAVAPLIVAMPTQPSSADEPDPSMGAAVQTRYRTVSIDGVEVFYREAGHPDHPVVLLLHGFPTSSHMFRNLIPMLADTYRVIAPDYPGFGHSAMPDRSAFPYSFDGYAGLLDSFTAALGIDRYALYLMDYGAPIGFRLAARYPDRVTTLIVQNGNAYEEGLGAFWQPIQAYWASGAPEDREALRAFTVLDATRWQYIHGVPDSSLVSPDAWTVDQAFLDRPGNQEIQLDLFYDYRTNIPLYPEWQAYLRAHQPPTLIVWGRNDEIFLADGADPYTRDLPGAELHLLDTGHFALETHGAKIAGLMQDFLGRTVPTTSGGD